jgi:hypothetical protein
MVATPAPGPEVTSASASKSEDLSEVVLRVLENSGWRPPPAGEFCSGPPSPRFGSPNANKFCDNCKQFGHPTESCWADIECDQCHRMGHPARACRTRPCTWCNKFHEGKCDEWKALQDSRSTGSTEGLTTFNPEATSGWRWEFWGNATVKPVSSLDGDPERAGLKETPELCVRGYVGPELRCQKQHKQ